jgi:hypothetical protein
VIQWNQHRSFASTKIYTEVDRHIQLKERTVLRIRIRIIFEKPDSDQKPHPDPDPLQSEKAEVVEVTKKPWRLTLDPWRLTREPWWLTLEPWRFTLKLLCGVGQHCRNASLS